MVYQNSLLIGAHVHETPTCSGGSIPFPSPSKIVVFLGSNSSEIPNSPNSRSSFHKVLLFRYHLPAPFALPTARWPGSCWRSASVSWVSRSTQRSSYRKCSATRACASCASKSPWSGCGWLGDGGWGTKATKDGLGKNQKVDGGFQVLLGWSWLFWSLLHNLHMGLFQMEVFQDIVATTLAGVLCCQSGISTAGGLNPHEELRPNRTKLSHQGILSGWLPSGKLI